jgi:uncharacterized repeat protein (TIGR02543 family)
MNMQTFKNRSVAIALTISLALSGVLGFGSPASASTASNPTIVFDGNFLATSVPATQAATRVSADSLALSTESLSRTTTTTRSGYTFGGWALTQGGAATTAITTATTSDTSRTIFAVWNTTITYNVNGADSGSPAGAVSASTYRFGQNLSLPTVGTMVKSGFAFAGWMNTSISTNRFDTYSASADSVGSPTLFAAWIKTVAFNANTATAGTIPFSQTFLSGGSALRLPVISEMTLRKPGYDFVGWSTTTTGPVVSNPTAYVPLVSQQTLYAIWKLQTTKASSKVFFKPGRSTLQASQKLVLRDLVDSLRGKKAITIQLAATRARTAAKSLGKARNTAVSNYLNSLGVTATYVRTNTVGTARLATAPKNNRVSLNASWTNPTN